MKGQVREVSVGADGSGRYSIKIDTKFYYAIVIDRQLRNAWVVATNHILKRNKPAWNLVKSMLQDRVIVD